MNICVIDANSIIRRGIAEGLLREGPGKDIAEYAWHDEVPVPLPEFDLVLVGEDLGDGVRGIEYIEKLRTTYPHLIILGIITGMEHQYPNDAYYRQAGADGVFFVWQDMPGLTQLIAEIT